MNTIIVALSILQIAFFGLFNYFGFILIERLLMGRRNKRAVYVAMVLLNTGSGYILILNYSAGVAFFAALLIMIIEIVLLYNASAANVLYGTMAIVINCMCLHGMVASVFAWVNGIPFSALSGNVELSLAVSMTTAFTELLVVLGMLLFVPAKNVVAAIKLPRQKSFMLLWMSICVIFMFLNSGIYHFSRAYSELYELELTFCAAILMSCYFMLFNSYRMNKSIDVILQNRRLSNELGNQKRLQNALLRDSLFYCEANLTKNQIITGADLYMPSFAAADCNYDLWIDNLAPSVHPDDWEYFKPMVERENLIAHAQKGTEPQPFLYRRDEGGGHYRWIRVHIRLLTNDKDSDVLAFAYSFDVDADINREKELVEKSKMDIFTGLLNKATAQSMIREQVRNGVGALYILDIDNFKRVNDTLGHDTGDQILKFVATSFKSVFSGNDIVGRVGGDEFMAFSANDRKVKDVAARAEELFSKLADKSDPARPNYDFTASLGVSFIGMLAPDFTSAYKQADMALAYVKQSGKNSFSIYGAQQLLFDYA